MNYPDSEHIGTVSEDLVRLLFRRWRWTIATDKPDIGYDLLVEPDRDLFKSARFLVQVKGTTDTSPRGYFTPVERYRLRQYAESEVPVFVVRVLGDETILWLHAQSWCVANADRLVGDGKVSIRMDPVNCLDDKQAFMEVLKPLLLPLAQRPGGLVAGAKARSTYLSSLDERFRVHAAASPQGEEFIIYARQDTNESLGKIRMLPTQDATNWARVRRTFEYGVPTEFSVKSFRITGSPLFDALGMSEELTGKVSMGPTRPVSVTLTLQPGRSYNATARSFQLEARGYHGSKGAVIATVDESSPLHVQIEFTPDSVTGATLTTFNLRSFSTYLESRPLRDCIALKGVVDWVDDVLSKRAMVVSAANGSERLTIPVGEENLERFLPVIETLGTLGKLQVIAEHFGSPFMLAEDTVVTARTAEDIDRVYALLRGDRLNLEPHPIDISAAQTIDYATRIVGIFITKIEIRIGEGVVATCPVVLAMDDYDLGPADQPGHIRLTPREGTTLFMFHCEGEPDLDAVFADPP